MSGPVILTLGSWAEQHMREMMTAKTQSSFEDAFDAMVAPSATITVNGKHMTREQYKKMLWKEEANEANATITFRDMVEVPKSAKEIIQTGEVGMFFEANISWTRPIKETKIRSTMNMVVEESSRPAGDSMADGRLATVVNQVMTDVVGPEL
ncbi:hypothetical protein PsYK624_091800 [Phanerochaete sordida]|uniref:Uncharacterized protein n=1 Tax=Phanerochaete sordida TaxID=48140 RepID=A0A9P3GDQ0_9APHY|nr:hypothetical protein PsYK624_091800 [Phanerochaete sordida]